MTVVLFVFQFHPVCNFGEFITTGLDTVRSVVSHVTSHAFCTYIMCCLSLKTGFLTMMAMCVCSGYYIGDEEDKNTLKEKNCSENSLNNKGKCV